MRLLTNRQDNRMRLRMRMKSSKKKAKIWKLMEKTMKNKTKYLNNNMKMSKVTKKNKVSLTF